MKNCFSKERRRVRLVSILAGITLTAMAAGCAPATIAEPNNPPAKTPVTTQTPHATGGISTQTPTGETNTQTPTGETSTPSTDSSPSATSDPSGVMPGTNHNAAAKDYVYTAKQVQSWLQGTSKAPEKIVFLTFDDGPSTTITPRILNSLKQAGVNATFFVVGSAISNSPEMMKRAVAEGNSIAIHSWSHNYRKLYPRRTGNTERIIEEYEQTLSAIRDVLGKDFKTSAWRYPGGHMSWKGLGPADEALLARGVRWIDWNGMTGDAEARRNRPTTAAGMVQMATAPIRNGNKVAVILAHDIYGKELTAEATPQIIAAYKKAGYKFGIIS